MKQIGITSSGSVIVEMSPDEFKALSQSASKTDPTKLSTAELVSFVKERIVKLRPKKRAGVAHSIAAMFQFNGRLEEGQTQKVIMALQKQGVLSISPDGKVSYPSRSDA